jgi:hypothetical protein
MDDLSNVEYAKISRNGHAFWVGNIRRLDTNVFVGTMENNIGDERFPIGSIIAFVTAEVGETVDKHSKPDLKIV